MARSNKTCRMQRRTLDGERATSRSPIKPCTFTRWWPVIGDPRPRIACHLCATAISQCETTRLGKTCEWVRFWNHGSVSRGCALSFPPTNHLLPTCCLRLLHVGTGRDGCVPPVPGYPGAQLSLLIDLFASPISSRLIDTQPSLFGCGPSARADISCEQH